MSVDLYSAVSARRVPFRKVSSDDKMSNVPTNQEHPRSSEWTDYSNEEAGLQSTDGRGHEDEKIDSSW